MNILILAPHPDDEAIGCGGTICRHADNGDRVVSVFLTSGELGLKNISPAEAWATREREAQCAAKILGIAESIFLRLPDWFLGDCVQEAAQKFRPILERESPELIYLPHANDGHPDHQAALPVLRVALIGTSIAPVLKTYEVWTPLSEVDHVEDITALMPRKLRALRCHRSQLNDFDYARAVRGLNAFRGALAAKCRYAEVFQTVTIASEK